ncbi:PAS domain S-box protein [Rhodanobacter sp. L36]|uniref:hybrid sensor histidine kinase/response regulator n=1 Tax=Rhodanobacter sp. L36 TaxID=1747221 RepID=UPI001C20A245|nr:PAS domain S-box protein [Rhodanobacter sp. L36]
MTLLWGVTGVMIYNDAYQDFAGGRHPALLGSNVLEGWPEVADFNAHVLSEGLAGRTLNYDDKPLVLMRKGEPEDVWLTLDYSPLVDDSGTPVGVLAIVKETTTKVLAEETLKLAQEIGGVGTFEWFPETGRMEVSAQYRRIWDLPPDVEVTDSLLVDLVHPDDRRLLGPGRLDAANPIRYSEFRRVDPKTGAIKWIARRGEPFLKGVTQQRRYIGIAMDITERKEAEEATARSEFRWRELFERMQEGFFVASAIRDDSGKMVDFMILEINPAFGVQTGLDAANSVGHSIRELVPSIDDVTIATYAEVLATGIPRQFEIHTPGLGNRWFEARARRMDAERFAVLFVEISARKRSEENLRQSEERFRQLAQSMPNQIWTADREGRLNWFNDRVYDYFGTQPGSLDGDGWTAMLHPDDIGRALSEWEKSLVSRQPYNTEFRLRRHDGSYRWYSVRAVPIFHADGSIERWVGNNADIEDQKAVEAAMSDLAVQLERRVEERTADLVRTQEALRQSQKMEAIGNLTGGVAHDFNNLLQVISGNLQLVADDIADNERASRRVNNAMAGVARGSKLASQLLAFGRRQPLAPRAVNPARLLRSMDDLLRRSLGEEIELETVISGGLWNTFIDAGNLENALLNLAINARDAMNGKGRLTIEAGNAWLDEAYVQNHLDAKAGQYVLVAVTDTGCGMDASLLEKVFEPFYTTKAEGRGSGLGLSMVHGFVKQSEGHIKIYSEPGHGTTVKLYLPRSTKSEEVIVSGATGPVEGGSETILVAEDDDAVRETVVALLGNLGYRVLQSRDGRQALAVIESGASVDLLFTDVVMPGDLRSPDLARLARKQLPELAVLFTSGYTQNAIVHGGRLDEGVDLLSKPYTSETMARKVRSVLAAQAQRNAAARLDAVPILGGLSSTISADAKTVRPLRVLLCEDDDLIRIATHEMLEAKGFHVVGTPRASVAEKHFRTDSFDVLVTDITLPDISGIELAKRLWQIVPDLPVVFSTGQLSDEAIPLEGKVGTLLKPYGAAELMGEIRRLTS